MSKRSITLSINLAIMCGASILVFNPLVVGRFIQSADWTVPTYLLGVDLFLVTIVVCCVLYVRRLRARYFYLSLIGLAVLPVLMVITELGLTYIDLLDRGQRIGNQLQDVHQSDRVLGWTLVPDSFGRHYSAGNYDVTYSIDPVGRRTTIPNTSAGRHLSFFGDSFIFGQGVENEETALYLLAKRKQVEFDVLNYGVMGYSLEQMYLRYRSTVDEIRANDVVVFSLLSEDLARNLIAKDHVCSFTVGGSDIKTFPSFRGREWQFVKLNDECGFLETLSLNAHKYLFGKILFHYRRLTLHNEIVKNADAILAQASALAESRGAIFIVLILANPKECAQMAHQIDLSGLETPFVSLLPYCPEDPETLRRLHFPSDYHWSPYGNRWAAQAIEEVLDSALSPERRVE